MSPDTEAKKCEDAARALLKKLSENERKAGRACDLDDFPVRAEWSYLRSRQTPDRAFQIYIDATFSLTGDESGDSVVSTALVASGRLGWEALEMFFNRWTDDGETLRPGSLDVIAVFRDKALRGEQAEHQARQEAAERAEAELAAANVQAIRSKGFRERVQEQLARFVHGKVRRDGVQAAPVVSLPPKGVA